MTQQLNPVSRLRRALTASIVAAAAAALVALVGEFSHRQITHAHRNDFRDDPSRWGFAPAEEIWLTTSDGIRLHSWLFLSAQAVATVIVLHGHGGNKDSLLPLARMLYPRFNVIMLDLRGHGESDGQRTTIGYEERLDVHAAVDVLVERGLGPVGVFGMSMGGATAIMAAAEDRRIAAVVADSPFARLRWAIARGAEIRGYPAFLAPLVAWLGCWATALHLGRPMKAFDPVEVVNQIAPRPLFLLHGVEDDVIPVRSAHLLYHRAGQPKELWLIEGQKHCQALENLYEPYKQRLVGFFEGRLAAAARASQPPQATQAASAAAIG
jgi:pimeloyl-ACP methyl ester carboxylesterase